MTNALRTSGDYELFVYTLTEQFPIVQRSTVRFIRLGTTLARVKSTHPHHKHVPPNIKHNRIPAPEMSFTRPNLPALIREIEEMLKALDS
jgi:hypothetical protein